ncbi:MAG: 4Fe-4S dicluster domain-containing protein [Planctomycetes bacterium]|nr:4Fe-4S dicluster domain-containing protein [Planctomycetota bacterium]
MNSVRLRLLLMAAVLILYALSYAFGPAARSAILSWQFSPGLMALGWTMLFTVAMVVLALFFGRIYCSVLCPAGILQEFAFRVGRKFRLARLAFAASPRSWVLMLVVALLVFAGFAGIASLVEPVGWYGRLVAPVVAVINDFRFGTEYSAGYVGLAGVGFALAVGVLVIVPLFRGRWFCDRLCPIGAALGTCSSLGRRRVHIAPEKCVSCLACEKVCPTRCIDGTDKRIHAERCVLCQSCTTTCPTSAIRYGHEFSTERRRVIAGGLAWLGTVMFLSARAMQRGLTSVARWVGSVLPPGAVTADRFFQKCIGCQSCVKACPVGIIMPAAAGVHPAIRFVSGYCQFECTACTQSCPTGALTPLSVEEKKLTRIARTEFSLYNCVVITQKTACGACAEVCPVHALTMVESLGAGPPEPEFNPDVCIGCGACKYVCPARPLAFTITGLAVHERATPPETGRSGDEDGPVDSGGALDFPF